MRTRQPEQNPVKRNSPRPDGDRELVSWLTELGVSKDVIEVVKNDCFFRLKTTFQSKYQLEFSCLVFE